MNNVLPFKKKPAAPAFDLNSEALSVVLHLKRLKRSGEVVHQSTSFELADQVLTHLLITAGVDFDLFEDGSARGRESIRSITSDRYGLKLIFGSNGLAARDLLAGWSIDALVQYVLDHEVPVDPRDIPGFSDQRLVG
ncbi:MAG: hypothetical protein QNJ29_14580 [Rhizobiaceae bacterium]|nr:hypothetical protein [Rhizobiaceae bacterium]